MNVQRFLGVGTLPDKLDTTIELILTRTQSKKKHKHPEKEETDELESTKENQSKQTNIVSYALQ